MTDFRRLNQGGGEASTADFTRLLISSAQSEEPSSHAQRAALASLGIAGAALGLSTSAQATATVATSTGVSGVGSTAAASTAATGTAAASAGAGTAAGSAVGASTILKVATLKWVGVALVGSTVALGAGSALLVAHHPSTVEQRSSAVEQGPSAKPAQSPTAVTAKATPQLQERVAQPSGPEAQRPAGDLEAPRAVHQRSTETVLPSGSAPSTSAPSVLAKEVLLLDRTRESLAAGQSSQALNSAQEYIRSFPHGSLLPEAVFLKMQSERNLGRTADAATSAKQLIRIAPRSPQAGAAQEFLDSRR